MPQLRPVHWIREQAPALGPGSLVSRPFLADLAVCYVIDEPAAMTFVTQAHLRHWGQTLERIDELALANLRRSLRDDPSPATPNGIALQSRGDGYDATRLLLQADAMDPDLAPAMCFAVPQRDALWMAPATDTRSLNELMARVREEHRQSEHPVSSQLFRLTAAGWQTLSTTSTATPRAGAVPPRE
jgi:uncharacterized protein YtpQ (UPF0354 family)